VLRDRVAPNQPTLALDADDGPLADGAVTSDKTLLAHGTAEAGSTVRVYDGSNVVGTATADANGAWSVVIGSETAFITGGVHSFSATATDPAGNQSAHSASHAVEIDASHGPIVLTHDVDTFLGLGEDTTVSAAPGTITVGDVLAAGEGVDRIVLTAAGTLDLTAAQSLDGFETLTGSAGDDTFVFDAARLAPFTGIDGGSGVDTLEIEGGGHASLVGKSLNGIEHIVLKDTAGTKLQLDSAALFGKLNAHAGSQDGLIFNGALNTSARLLLAAAGFEHLDYLVSGRRVEDFYGPDGVLDRVLVTDTPDSAFYAYVDQLYSGGQLSSKQVKYDNEVLAAYTYENGVLKVLEERDWWTNAVSYNTRTSYYTDGVITSQAGLFDNGNRWIDGYTGGIRTEYVLTDSNGNEVFSSKTHSYDLSGALTQLVIEYDDGRVLDYGYSNGEIVSLTTPLGNGNTLTRSYTNGHLSERLVTDSNNDEAFATLTLSYDSAGALTRRAVKSDNGSIVEFGYSNDALVSRTTTDAPSDLVNYQSFTDTFTDGVVTGQTGLYDNGNTWNVSYQNGVRTSRTISDANADETFETKTTDYAGSGEVIRTVTTFDDGHREHLGGAVDATLTGTAGMDVFVFRTPGGGIETIDGFVPGQDKLSISAANFGGGLQRHGDVAFDVVSDAALSIRPDAGGAFIYDHDGADAGVLYWDQNGGDGADAVVVARFSDNPLLRASDFLVV
jgi:hypothetical protein